VENVFSYSLRIELHNLDYLFHCILMKCFPKGPIKLQNNGIATNKVFLSDQRSQNGGLFFSQGIAWKQLDHRWLVFNKMSLF